MVSMTGVANRQQPEAAFEWSLTTAIATIARVRWVFVFLAFFYSLLTAYFVPQWPAAIGVPRWLFAFGLPTALAIYTGFIHLGNRRGYIAPQLVVQLALFGDLVFATVALVGTFGIVSGMWALYVLITLEAAYLTGQLRITAGVASLATGLYSAVVLSEWDFMTISGFKNLSGQAPSAIWVDFSLWYELLSILWMALMQVGTIVLSVMVLGQRERYHARLFQMYQQLDQQLAALRQLDRLKNSFLSTVSHELRTPLTILQGCQELLGEQNGVSQTAEYYIEESRKATALLAKRVNLMLAYTTLASGEETLVYDDFNPGELFQYVTSQQQGSLMRARMTLHCAASPSVYFYGDRAWLTEALNQLVLNAIQAGAPGGRIWLDASADADCDRLLVSDDGPGLPPAIRQQFGEPFAQVDWRLTEHAPGLGLGLAFAKLVSLAHRGQLGFRDRPQGGTVIIMSLPHKSPATTGTLHPNALPSS